MEQWVHQASRWFYRWKQRKGYVMLAVAGAGRNDIADPEAECDLRSCENGCLSAFLVQVEKGNVTGWDLSFPLGTTSGASRAAGTTSWRSTGS